MTGLTNGTTYTFRVAATNCRRDRPELGCIAGGDAEGRRSRSTRTSPSPTASRRGNFSNWTGGTQGTGTASVQTVAAHSGTYGARITTLETQYAYFSKGLASPLQDSLTTFWIRTGAAHGSRPSRRRVTTPRLSTCGRSITTAARHGFIFYPYRQSGSTEIFTGNNTAASGVWIKVQIEYKADAAGGGAQLYLNGVTRNRWSVKGNYSRTANLQRIQLWNEGLTNNDFDDVTVYTIPPPGVNPSRVRRRTSPAARSTALCR